MDILHRYNSAERQHYSIKKQKFFKLKPRLLYVGELKRSGGWSESNHAHDFCEIMFVVEGEGNITVDAKTTTVKKGDIIIYNPLITHFEESSHEEPLDMFFMAIDKFEVAGLEKNFLLPTGSDYIYTADKYYNIFYTIFKQMITEFKKENDFYIEISQNLAISVLMYIFRIVKEEGKQPFSISTNSKTVDDALTYIKANYHKNITLEDIAGHCFVNKYYLAHEFTKQVGVSIAKYIINLRLSEAMQLLRETKMSVNEISDKVGFYDISYFCRTFKKNFSLTPLEYRRHDVDSRD